MVDPASDARMRVFIRLFRLWAMAREDGELAADCVQDAADELHLPANTAMACASLFELVEAGLGRPLLRECCCAREFSSDELALIGVLRIAPEMRGIHANASAPHGLPGAMRWAAMTVRRSLGWADDNGAPPIAAGCPFKRAGAAPGTPWAVSL